MKEYKIVSVMDFLNVPPDKLDACLEELKGFLESVRAFQEMVKIAGELVGEPNAECVPIEFVWINDGKRDHTITVVPIELKPTPAPA